MNDSLPPPLKPLPGPPALDSGLVGTSFHVPVIVGIVSGIFGVSCVAACSAIVAGSFSGNDTVQVADVKSPAPTERERIQERVQQRRQEEQERAEREAAGREREIAEQKRQLELALPADTRQIPYGSANSQPHPEDDVPLPDSKPFDDIRNKLERNLRIPTPDDAGPGWVRLAEIEVDSPQDVTALEILGADAVLQAGYQLAVLPPNDTSAPSEREWLVQIEPPQGSLTATEKIGAFRLAGKELYFRWQQPGVNALLVDMELKLTGRNRLGEDSVICRLRAPEYRRLLKLTENARVEVKLLDSSRVGAVTGLKLNYSIDGLSAEHRGQNTGTLAVGIAGRASNPVRITQIYNGDGVVYSLPEFELSLTRNDQGHLVLVVNQFLSVPKWDTRANGVTLERQPLTPRLLENYPNDSRKFGIVVAKHLPAVESQLKAAQDEFNKTKVVVDEARQQISNSKNEPAEAASARAKLPGAELRLRQAQSKLMTARSSRDALLRSKEFHKTSARWYELVQLAHRTMLQDVRIHYELQRESGSDNSRGRTSAAPVLIVATRAEEVP